MLQFNPIDAALLFLESAGTPFHVSTVSVYDPSTCPGKPPSFEDIVEAVRVSLPAAPAFRRKIVRVAFDVDHPYWVEDKDFELDFHMRHIALPKPGNWTQFREQVSRLISRPLDLARAPWEMTVIEGLDGIEGLPKGCFATVLKVHHCAVDGKTGVAIINALHQDSPDKMPAVIEDNWQPEAEPSSLSLMRRAAINSIRSPFVLVRPVLANATALVKSVFAQSSEDDIDLKAPPSMLNGPISAHRIFDYAVCSLEDMKRVRRSVEGATINDVCLTIVAQGMRRYLAAKKGLPKESLVTVVPISIRTPDSADATGNQIAITRVSMRTDIADPIERLRSITVQTGKKKAMQDGVVMSVLLKVVYKLPGALIGAVARAVPLVVANGSSFCNTMVTNVPGPATPIYFLGAKAVKLFGSPPLMDGGGVLHSVGSYNGQFMFSFVACRKMVPDADFYRECLEVAAQEVIAAADKVSAAADKESV